MLLRLMVSLLVVGAAIVSGCSSGGPPKVSGTVSFEGTPVEDGRISFEPSDGQGPTAEGVISKGAYTVEVPAGKKKVKIVAMKVVSERPAYAGQPNSPMIQDKRNFIPPRFNDQTELTADITKSAPLNFELKSTP